MTDEERQIRDKNLCEDWLDWHNSDCAKIELVGDLIQRLTIKYSITQAYVYQTLKKNANILIADKEWRKAKRIFRLDREIANKPKSSKDLADLMEQQRKELEGDKPVIDLSTHLHKTYSFDYGTRNLNVQSPQEPSQNTRLTGEVYSGGMRETIRQDDNGGNGTHKDCHNSGTE